MTYSHVTGARTTSHMALLRCKGTEKCSLALYPRRENWVVNHVASLCHSYQRERERKDLCLNDSLMTNCKTKIQEWEIV